MYDIASLDGSIVSLVNYGVNSAIDVAGVNPTEGALLVGNPLNLNGTQQWKFEKISDGPVWPIWKIQHVDTGKYADLDSGSHDNGAKIRISSPGETASDNQHWCLVSADPDFRVFMIMNVASGTYIDLFNGSPKPGTPVQGWKGNVYDKNSHQLWKFGPVPGA
ncbi:hypothetical protein ONZ43_g5522 [Nemania bipapillata]|uniref:Uncharacterized protein n=1 Tax=Nemania bipapillata TaxID=110536 RepID=A0ACC2I9T9_9PEZI|nr:hypothetical protein ONZ43_g5522 [Nemania bipapillata]